MLIVRDCISVADMDELVIINERINTKMFLDILKHNLKKIY